MGRLTDKDNGSSAVMAGMDAFGAVTSAVLITDESELVGAVCWFACRRFDELPFDLCLFLLPDLLFFLGFYPPFFV